MNTSPCLLIRSKELIDFPRRDLSVNQLTDLTNAPEFVTYYAMQRPTAAACLACPELGVCGGGMPVNRWRDDNGYDNPSVYCADQLLLIGHMRNRLATLLSPGQI